jgi:hypothetical protein
MPFTACHTHHQPHPATTHAHAYAHAYAHRTEPGSRCTQTHDTPQRKPARPRQSNENAPTNNTTQKNKSIQTIRTNTTDNPPPHPHRPNKTAQTAQTCRHSTELSDARVHYPDLKQQPHTHHTHTTQAHGNRPGSHGHRSRFTFHTNRSQVPKPGTEAPDTTPHPEPPSQGCSSARGAV